MDEDYVINKRKTAVSALIFGTTSFLAKPGQTLAPLIGTYLIASETGIDLFSMNSPLNIVNLHSSDEATDNTSLDIYRNGCFQILILVPIFCAFFQLISWQKFNLHSKRLKMIKEARVNGNYNSLMTV